MHVTNKSWDLLWPTYFGPGQLHVAAVAEMIGMILDCYFLGIRDSFNGVFG
jgi:hypothetical protein